MIDLDALVELAESATAGPWTVGYWPLPEPTHYIGALDTDNPISSKLRAHVTGHIPIEADARFLVACDPETVLALVRAVRAAQALDRADTALVATQLEAGTATEIAGCQAEYAKAMFALGEALVPFGAAP